jgi:hypothetical protein
MGLKSWRLRRTIYGPATTRREPTRAGFPEWPAVRADPLRLPTVRLPMRRITFIGRTLIISRS